MVIVEHRVGERRSHVTDLLCLSHEVECAMLNELQDIGHSVGTMQINVTLFLAHEGLVTQRLEELPSTDEVLNHTDVRTCLDIEVACIKEATDIQTRNQFIRFIFRICCCTL